MTKYEVRLTPNDLVLVVEAEDENTAIDEAIDMATGGYADLWDLFHHCGTEVTEEEPESA